MRRFRINTILPSSKDVWPIYKEAGQAPAGWQGWPEKKQFALLLTHDVESAKGRDRCRNMMDIEERFGFRSAFYFVPKKYEVSSSLLDSLASRDFEAGVHGLKHDGKLYNSKRSFRAKSVEINKYLKKWNSEGFSSPCMQHNLEWIGDLDIRYDISTYDTDPFEPQGGCIGSVFPFCVQGASNGHYYVEIPYTLPQDFTVFVLMKEKNIDIWTKKLDWIAEHGGMVHLKTHPDYLNFDGANPHEEEYPVSFYAQFLEYIKKTYAGRYWHALPRDMARFYSSGSAKGDARTVLKPSRILCPTCRKLVEKRSVTFFSPFGDNKHTG